MPTQFRLYTTLGHFRISTTVNPRIGSLPRLEVCATWEYNVTLICKSAMSRMWTRQICGKSWSLQLCEDCRDMPAGDGPIDTFLTHKLDASKTHMCRLRHPANPIVGLLRYRTHHQPGLTVSSDMHLSSIHPSCHLMFVAALRHI